MAGSRHQHSSQQPPCEHEYCDVQSKQSGKTHRIRVPQCDIDASIKFSWLRCLFSISGILLVLSDIPRSGFGVFDLAADFKQVAPNTVLYFGPYAYCGAQIHREDNGTSFTGICGSSTLAVTQVWAYKYDSLSIALRGIVQALDVHEYPRCLLYVTKCASEYLSLGVTFTMLDALVSTLYEHHFQHKTQRDDTFTPYVLQTTSYWIDRLHHIVLDKVGYRRIDMRLHVAYYYQCRRDDNNTRHHNNSSLRLCHPELSGIYDPVFCAEIIGWNIDVAHSPDYPNTAAGVKINADEHIEWRLSTLEQQHPHLEFDLTVLTTLQATSNRERSRFGAETYYKSESNEIITVIRGRVCDRAASASSLSTSDRRCTTQLIDDFRYERALLYTNVEDWYNIVRFLRATAQVYMWVRIACLWGGCYLARRGEPKFIAAALPQRLYWTTVTIFKIPSHVIVYGSWIPIVLYVLAYGFDCGIVHLLCERVWTSLNGAVRFDFFAYVKAASVQMRNAWLVALAVNALALLQVRCLTPRHAPWILRHGLVGVRGGLIGLLSSITIFSYLRFPAFRETKIVTVRELSVEALRVDQHNMQQFETASEFGFFFDLRAILVGIAAVLCATLVLKLYLWWLRWWYHRRGDAHESGFTTKVIFSRLHGLPYSVGTLVSLTALSVFWHITVLSDTTERAQERPRKLLRRVSSNKVAALETALPIAPFANGKNLHRLPSLHEPSLCSKPHCRMCARRRSSLLMMRDAVDLNVFFDVEKRLNESWAMVQLINIALLTEPRVLWNLVVTGRDLYVYRPVRSQAHSRDSSAAAPELSQQHHHALLFLLPCDPQTLARNTEDAASDPLHYELVDTTRHRYLHLILIVERTTNSRVHVDDNLLATPRSMTKHARTTHARSASSKESSTHGCVRVRSSHRGKSYQVQVPANDMDACIKFSWVRCIYSIIGMLLVASDIPRTGYGVQAVLDSFERVAPGTTIYFGPFAYGIAQITKTMNASSNTATYTGTCDAVPIAATDVWSYKFDSLSISLRSVAHALGVLASPPCLFYRSACPSSTLSLETTFTMLDALASSVDARQHEPNATIASPLVFHTQSYWVDRLGHYLHSKLIWRRVDSRFHAVHHYRHTSGSTNKSLDLCPLKSMRSPFFCEQLVPWTVDEVTFASNDDTVGSTRRVKIADHIAHRFAALERAHAHLTFDMTVFTTRFPTSSTSPIPIIPTVRFRSDNNEVTTVIRGRICNRGGSSSQHNGTDSDASDCETVLVDDYRYEIATLETDFEDWYKFTFMVRVLAQLYVWLRLLLLWVGCYCARRYEPAFAASSLLRRMLATWATVFKIPSHILIYGSWVPIIMYALAHYMDSGIVHTVCENVLASVNGVVDLDVFVYVNIASVQMRNIWYVALVVKCIAAAQVYVLPQRRSPWMPHDGFLGVRGSVIGAISFFTMFAFLRSARFRNADVMSLTELAPHTQRRQSEFTAIEPSSEFGFRFDARMLSLIACLLTCGTAVVKVYLVCGDSVINRALQRHLVVDADAVTNVSISRMPLIPYSAGTLAPLSVLSLFWKIHLQRSTSHTRDTAPRSLYQTLAQASLRNLRSAKVAALDGVLPSTHRRERPRSQESSSGSGTRHRSSTESKPSLGHRETLLYVSRRTPELWSVVKLMNIALLTEPLALLQLYISGCELYLYHCTKTRTGTSSHRGSAVVSPPPEQLYLLPCDPIAFARHTHESGDVYELVATTDSTSVPWHLLILCG